MITPYMNGILNEPTGHGPQTPKASGLQSFTSKTTTKKIKFTNKARPKRGFKTDTKAAS